MMKKVLLGILTVVIALSALAGCSGDNQNNTNTSTASTAATSTEEKKVLRVGMECAYAPFNWTQETEEVPGGAKAVPIAGTNYYAYGYDVMMAEKIADTLGWDLEIYKVEWDSIGMGLDSGNYDAIIAGMGKTEERAAVYDFTEPYYYRDVAITVKKGSGLDEITSLSEFAGKNVTVTTQTGTAWVNLLDQIPDVELGPNFATTAECFMAVANGAVEASVIDLPTSQTAAMTNSDLVVLDLKADDTIEDPTGSTNVCIAVRKGDTELLNSIQGAMDELKWNDKAAMDEMMGKAIELQPAAN
ncbi:transporter substrate-binding domain-containing protein [Scatolibacter rhodanostii]|uniref:transporter substrate-binding domain-containing protein n=1 Tax=Scatolibacter rhodanostii TaxID=2014781 RepID=UPI000C083656|nr:transporter substrate-binding domain-containing protein [Scatolibacter rhodanostii]